MLILNSEIYISHFLLIPGLIFSGKTFLECAGLECKTRGHGNTAQKREAANIARSKNSKTLLIAYVFLVSVNTPICAVHTSRYYIISMYMLTNAYTSNNNHHFCHKYLSEWWQEEEEEETPSQRNRGQVELQNRRS